MGGQLLVVVVAGCIFSVQINTIMKNVKVGCLGYLKVHHHPVHLQEKSLKMKGDVGMACQKVHKQGKINVMVSIQSPIPTSLLLCEKM